MSKKSSSFDWLGICSLARMWGVGEKTARRIVDSGEVPCKLTEHGVRMVSRSDAETYKRARKQQAVA